MKTLYTAHAITTAGREGHSETDDKRLVLDLARPGGAGKGTNPEQLFACGYSACFGGAVAAVAKNKGLNAGEVKVAADVTLNQDDAGGFFIGATLNVTIGGLDEAATTDVVKAAHQMCPYSKATRGNIDVKLQVGGKAIAV